MVQGSPSKIQSEGADARQVCGARFQLEQHDQIYASSNLNLRGPSYVVKHHLEPFLAACGQRTAIRSAQNATEARDELPRCPEIVRLSTLR